MFTGLIADLGRVAARHSAPRGAALVITSVLAADLKLGDSIAVNGVCLTARVAERDTFTADVMQETLRRSTLGALQPGALVNLELPLRAQDRLGGHIVQGHVDGLGTIMSVRSDGLATIVSVAAEPDLLRYVVQKGSIALDGASLTVSRVDERGFEVSLIPETLSRTTLGAATPTAEVNVEVDVMAKYLEKLVGVGAGG